MVEVEKPLVLVVEDEESVREIVCMDLEDAGFEVIEARSGDEAFGLFRQCATGERAVRLLFTDIQTPGSMDGWDLAEKTRDLAPALRWCTRRARNSGPASDSPCIHGQARL